MNIHIFQHKTPYLARAKKITARAALFTDCTLGRFTSSGGASVKPIWAIAEMMVRSLFARQYQLRRRKVS